MRRLAALDVVRALERRLAAPRRPRERRPIAAAELVAAALRDDVDDAAREAAVFGRDARGQHLHFADRVLDVEVVHDPSRLSLTSTPSTRKTLSNAKPPEMVSWSGFGVLVVTPGISSAMRYGVRPIGSALTSPP